MKHHNSISFCAVSDSLDHGPVAIWTDLDPIFHYLKNTFLDVPVVHIFVDNSVTHYKQNKIYFCFQKLFSGLLHEIFLRLDRVRGAAHRIGVTVKRNTDCLISSRQDKNAIEFYSRVGDKTPIKIHSFIKENKKNVEKIIPYTYTATSGTFEIHKLLTFKP